MWHDGTRADALGLKAEKICLEIWGDEFIRNESGNWLDLHGLDGWLRHVPVQIKGDRTLAKTKNFYKEHYKKTYETTKDTSLDDWRITPCYAMNLIFVTAYKAYVVSIDAFARGAIGRQVRQIKPTSIGVLVPMSAVDIKEECNHSHSLEEFAFD